MKAIVLFIVVAVIATGFFSQVYGTVSELGFRTNWLNAVVAGLLLALVVTGAVAYTRHLIRS